LSPEQDRVTEVAIVRVAGNKILDSYVTLVNPGRTIPAHIQQMTGITDAMVATAPTFAEVAQAIKGHLSGTVFAAHNVRFDHGFLRAEFARAGQELPPLMLIDTVALARQGFKGLPNYRLETLCDHLGLVAGKHRALGDATVAAELLIRLLGA